LTADRDPSPWWYAHTWHLDQPDGGRSRELRGALQIASVKQNYLEVLAKICPGGVARGTFRDKDGDDSRVADALETVAVAQHLAEAQTKLFLLVVVGDALDLGDESGIACLPGKVKVRLVRQAGPRRQARVAKDPRELVLCIGMPTQPDCSGTRCHQD
jgi:hypothetical protein